MLRRIVGDVLRDGMLTADLGDANVGRFARFAQGVVAAIEVLAFLVTRARESVGELCRGSGWRHSRRVRRRSLVYKLLGDAHLQLVLEEVFLIRELAVKAE